MQYFIRKLSPERDWKFLANHIDGPIGEADDYHIGAPQLNLITKFHLFIHTIGSTRCHNYVLN